MPQEPNNRGRDNFSSNIRGVLALRASYLCSICRRPTAGPQDGTDDKSVCIGVAAHISAAAPGGPRYDNHITAEERSSIRNGIWLCPDDAALIDRDVHYFTVQRLHEAKATHESFCMANMREPAVQNSIGDLISLGPGVLAVGAIVGGSSDEWCIRLRHFVTGGLPGILAISERFETLAQIDRFVLANHAGEGRELASPPRWKQIGNEYEVICPIIGSFTRTLADEMPADVKLENGDLVLTQSGDLAIVRGVEAVEQRLRLNLSLQVNDLPMHEGYGARLAELYRTYEQSGWLEKTLKLEVVRMASIPYEERDGKRFTPLMCVDRVYHVDIRGSGPEWMQKPSVLLGVDVEIAGLGRRVHEIPLSLS